MIRVLQMVDGMSIGGGIQAFIMNVYRNLDRDAIQFDFLLHRHNEKTFEPEIASLGGRIFYTPGRREGILKNRAGLKRFFAAHPEYGHVHFHASSLSYIEPLIAAYHAGVPGRIMHSHSSGIIGKNRIIHSINHEFNKKRIHRIATDYLACGALAGKWMYGGTSVESKVRLITNGIDIKRYSYSETVREEVRKELGIGKAFAVCHVGRFETVKNHTFLLDVFHAVLKKQPSALLILAGDGRLFNEVKAKAEALGIREKVRFLGVRNDVYRLFQAADCVVLPSLYEGFPVVTIEAQASGVPLVMSDTVTDEVVKKSNCRRISLDLSCEEWADAVLSAGKRIPDNKELVDSGFDIMQTVRELQAIYGSGYEGN